VPRCCSGDSVRITAGPGIEVEGLGTPSDPFLISSLGLTLLSGQVFTSNDNYSLPDGARFLRVRLVGPGGAGGGSALNSAAQASVGGGGSSGSYVEALIDATTLAPVTAVSVGTGGAGASGAAGGNGTQASFGAGIIAPGGPGGQTAQVATATNSILTAAGGLGATPPGPAGVLWYFALPGETGDRGMIINNSPLGGYGAASRLGVRARTANPGTTASGAIGGQYGGGGSGGQGIASGAATLGGPGRPGVVIVEAFA